MTFLLTSNGLQGKIADIFPSLLKKSASENSVAFVTTAAYGDEENPAWFDVYREQLREQNITDIEDLDIRGKNQHELEQILSVKDIVFVNGGNTFFLLHWIRQSGFDRALGKFLAQGKLYVGVSAGSIVVTPTIVIAGVEPADPNTIGPEDFTGLNLVDFEVSPHVPESVSYESAQAYSKTASHTVYAFGDTTAVLVEDGKVKIVGDGEYKIYN